MKKIIIFIANIILPLFFVFPIFATDKNKDLTGSLRFEFLSRNDCQLETEYEMLNNSKKMFVRSDSRKSVVRIQDGNTEEYSNYGEYINVLAHEDVQYFVGLKRKLKNQFYPVSPLRKLYERGELKNITKVESVIGVTVDQKGNFKKFVILRSSGFKIYDNDAIKAFKKISSLEEPPQDFLGSDKLLRMAWTFTVYL